MIEPWWPLGIGGRLEIDGEAVTVTSVAGAEVRGFTPDGKQVRFVLTRVNEEPAEACNDEWRFGSALADAGTLSAAQVRDAAELLAHLNEASFGYRSGDPGRRPRPAHGSNYVTWTSSLSGNSCCYRRREAVPVARRRSAGASNRRSPSSARDTSALVTPCVGRPVTSI
jgi:hypothetical protein